MNIVTLRESLVSKLAVIGVITAVLMGPAVAIGAPKPFNKVKLARFGLKLSQGKNAKFFPAGTDLKALGAFVTQISTQQNVQGGGELQEMLKAWLSDPENQEMLMELIMGMFEGESLQASGGGSPMDMIMEWLSDPENQEMLMELIMGMFEEEQALAGNSAQELPTDAIKAWLEDPENQEMLIGLIMGLFKG